MKTDHLALGDKIGRKFCRSYNFDKGSFLHKSKKNIYKKALKKTKNKLIKKQKKITDRG